MARKGPRLVRIMRVRLRRFSRRMDRNTPEWMKWLTPWATSLVLHAALLLVLGVVVYVGSDTGRTDEATFTTEFPQQLKEDVTALKKSDHAGDPFTTLKSDEPL